MSFRRILHVWVHFKQRRYRVIALVAIFQIAALATYLRVPSHLGANNLTSKLDAALDDQSDRFIGDGHSVKLNSPELNFDPDLVLTLGDDKNVYFSDVGPARNCFLEGTDFSATEKSNSSDCQCKSDYFGRECGIPAAVWFRHVHKKYKKWPLTPRKTPRRIIHGLNVNHEIDFFQVRLEELQDAVDSYIVCESNYTAHGDSKPLHLLEKLQSGFMKNFHSKIVYVPLLRFPMQGHRDGWYVDTYLRTYMGLHGLRRIHGVRGDDLFVLLDADEIPTREVLMFLKLYDGYPEPIRLAMRWSVFGFFWKRKKNLDDTMLQWFLKTIQVEKEYEEELLEITAISTMSMVWEVCRNNTFSIRKDLSTNEQFQERLSQYRNKGHRVKYWTVGTVDNYAGHHCSWCYSPEGIRTKLVSAHVDDRPRWGDYPEKTNLDYIRDLIRKGEWFDGTRPFLVADWEKEQHYAPTYILKNPDKYAAIFYPPSLRNTR